MEEEEEEEEQPPRGHDTPEAQRCPSESQDGLDGLDRETKIQLAKEIVEQERCLVLSSFTQALFLKLHEICGNSEAAAVAPVPSPATRHIFLLCRTSSLQDQRRRLQERLSELQRGSRNAPAALIAILVRPSSPAEADEAQRLLLRLLGEPCCREPPGPAPDLSGGAELDSVRMEMEAFVPDEPRGALHIMKAACRTMRVPRDGRPSDPKEEESGNRLLEAMSSKAVVLTALGAAAVAAGAAGAAYYTSEH